MRKINLVKFPDGTYGVRKGRFIHEFYDFVAERLGFWWGRGCIHFPDCKTTYERALKKYEELAGKEEILR